MIPARWPDEKDYLINPFPEDSGVTHAPTGNADMITESAIAHKQIKVDADVRERAVVHHESKEFVKFSLTKPALLVQNFSGKSAVVPEVA